MSERATSFWMDDEAEETLERLTRETGKSRSAIIREAIKTLDADAQMKQVRRLVNDLHKVVNGK
jgi:predicted DNA-binding protein